MVTFGLHSLVPIGAHIHVYSCCLMCYVHVPAATTSCKCAWTCQHKNMIVYHHRGELDFSACMDLKNPWNENKPVKISRDGQVQGTGYRVQLGYCKERKALLLIFAYPCVRWHCTSTCTCIYMCAFCTLLFQALPTVPVSIRVL